MTHFGELIRLAREAKGLRQRDVGDMLTGHPDGGQINKYESGSGSAPKFDRAAELIVALDLDPAVATYSYLWSYLSPEMRAKLDHHAATSRGAGEAPEPESLQGARQMRGARRLAAGAAEDAGRQRPPTDTRTGDQKGR